MKRLFGDGLLAYVVYAILFVAVFNSGTNAMQIGRMILLAIQADKSGMDVNRDLVRFIGVFALSLLCFLQYFSPTVGRKLNVLWAFVKIIFVIALIGVGGHAAATLSADQKTSWSANMLSNDSSSRDWAKALLSVLFSFEGWENATFVRRSRPRGIHDNSLHFLPQVAGEIPVRHQHILRRGFMLSVFIVGILYLLVVIVFVSTFSVLRLLDTLCYSDHLSALSWMQLRGRALRAAWTSTLPHW
jgi:amino acid transporter